MVKLGERLGEGEVVSVGPGVVGSDGKLQPVGVNVGDKVFFPSGTEQEFTSLGENLAIVRGDYITAFYSP